MGGDGDIAAVLNCYGYYIDRGFTIKELDRMGEQERRFFQANFEVKEGRNVN